MGMTDMQANDWEKIGLRIQNAIENTGNTQKKIAKEVGLTQETLSKYINARRKPSAEILQRISKVCGVSLEWLLGCDTPHKRIEMITSYLVMEDEDYQYYDNHGVLIRSPVCATTGTGLWPRINTVVRR